MEFRNKQMKNGKTRILMVIIHAEIKAAKHMEIKSERRS
jgi:hypothetical protein